MRDNYKTNRRENGNKPVFISLLSPPILVKSPKEINEISKIFKKNTDKKDQKIYFAHAIFSSTTSSSANITRDILKIKETFPNLQSKKIKNIQKSFKRKISPNLG